MSTANDDDALRVLVDSLNSDESLRLKFQRDPEAFLNAAGPRLSSEAMKSFRTSEALAMTEHCARAYQSSPSPRLAAFKTVSTLRPQYFSPAFPKEKVFRDQEFDADIVNVDLSHIFWRQKLDVGNVKQCLEMQDKSDEISYALDAASVAQYPFVRTKIHDSVSAMPGADELKSGYRILQRIISVINRCESGFDIHQSRGIVPNDFNPYALSEVFDVARQRKSSALWSQISDLLSFAALPSRLDVAILSLRNDVEFAQVAVLAALLKSRYEGVVIILETAGANEQFDFSNWSCELKSHVETAALFDYFLPRQDYRASLVPLVSTLLDRNFPNVADASNVVALSDRALIEESELFKADDIERAFSRHQASAGIFLAAGRKTLIARLSPARCHWSACSFCTINSQHVVPAGKKVFDHQTEGHARELITMIKNRAVESLILTDEAIHPRVLLAFAQLIVDADISIVYRARSRFTDELTPEACSLLARSGCHYLGMGLESASPRINSLFNKHHGPPPNYVDILQNLERSGIPPHIYAMMGFPTETHEEIKATEKFLVDAIKNSNYITVSANNFYLMKGSAVAKKPERWAITSISDAGNLSLTMDFSEPVHAANKHTALRAAQNIYREEFCPDGDDGEFAEGFWHFIDQSGIFYTQKTLYTSSPFRTSLTGESAVYCIRPHFMLRIHSSDKHLLCSWVTNKYLPLRRNGAEEEQLIRLLSAENRLVTHQSLIKLGQEMPRRLLLAGIIKSIEKPLLERPEVVSPQVKPHRKVVPITATLN